MTHNGQARAAVLTLDVGTSSCRASLYDAHSGRRLPRQRLARASYAPRTTADGGAELDPETLLELVVGCIDRLLSARRVPTIVGVATSTFWHGVLGVDGGGRCVGPLYLWLDGRARTAAAELRQRLDGRSIHARTGCELHWSYWPAKLAWLHQTRRDDVRAVKRWLSFGELLLERLTGGRGLSVSMASGTGLLDQHTCDWDPELLSALRLDRKLLGELVPLKRTVELVPSFARRWPSLRGVPWLPAVGDGACSNLGAGCTTDAWFAVMIGTSTAERVVRRSAGAFDIPPGVWCYRLDEQRLVLGGAMNDGGSLLGWLRGDLRLPALARLERELAQFDEPDAHGLTVLPFWGGERSTGWSDDARGGIFGLRLHTPPVDIVRAALEGVALRLGALDRLLRAAMPDAAGDVVGTGGALLHSPTWQQIVADVLGRPLHVSSEPEASSRGAALLAAETLGRLDSPLDQLQPDVQRVVEPRSSHTQRYAAAAERQQRLYDLLIAAGRG